MSSINSFMKAVLLSIRENVNIQLSWDGVPPIVYDEIFDKRIDLIEDEITKLKKEKQFLIEKRMTFQQAMIKLKEAETIVRLTPECEVWRKTRENNFIMELSEPMTVENLFPKIQAKLDENSNLLEAVLKTPEWKTVQDLDEQIKKILEDLND